MTIFHILTLEYFVTRQYDPSEKKRREKVHREGPTHRGTVRLPSPLNCAFPGASKQRFWRAKLPHPEEQIRSLASILENSEHQIDHRN